MGIPPLLPLLFDTLPGAVNQERRSEVFAVTSSLASANLKGSEHREKRADEM
jgi:hypothetical protein